MNALVFSKEDLWKQYEISVDLYKHYLKLTIEINVFYYAITGAIVNRASNSYEHTFGYIFYLRMRNKSLLT